MGGRGWAGWSGVAGGEWDNCNSIINKYIFKKSEICSGKASQCFPEMGMQSAKISTPSIKSVHSKYLVNQVVTFKPPPTPAPLYTVVSCCSLMVSQKIWSITIQMNETAARTCKLFQHFVIMRQKNI